MPYGTMDATTERYLTDAGIEIAAIELREDADTGTRVDIIFEGALDESFYVNDDADYSRVVDVIADRLADEWDEMGKPWTVDAYHVVVTGDPDYPDESDGSGPLYARHGKGEL